MLSALFLSALALADVIPIEPATEPLADVVPYDPTVTIGLSGGSCCCCSTSVLVGVLLVFLVVRSRGE